MFYKRERGPWIHQSALAVHSHVPGVDVAVVLDERLDGVALPGARGDVHRRQHGVVHVRAVHVRACEAKHKNAPSCRCCACDCGPQLFVVNCPQEMF